MFTPGPPQAGDGGSIEEGGKGGTENETPEGMAHQY